MRPHAPPRPHEAGVSRNPSSFTALKRLSDSTTVRTAGGVAASRRLGPALSRTNTTSLLQHSKHIIASNHNSTISKDDAKESDARRMASEAVSSSGRQPSISQGVLTSQQNTQISQMRNATTRAHRLLMNSLAKSEADSLAAEAGTATHKRKRPTDMSAGGNAAKVPRKNNANLAANASTTDNIVSIPTLFTVRDTLEVLGADTASVAASELNRALVGEPLSDTVLHIANNQIISLANGTMYLIHSRAAELLQGEGASMVAASGSEAAAWPDHSEGLPIEAGQLVITAAKNRLFITEDTYFDMKVAKSADPTTFRCVRVADAEWGRASRAISGPQLSGVSDSDFWKTSQWDLSSPLLPSPALPCPPLSSPLLQPGFPAEWEAGGQEIHVTHASPYAAFRDVIYKFDRQEAMAVPVEKNKALRWEAPRPAFVPLPRFLQAMKRQHKRGHLSTKGTKATRPANEIIADMMGNCSHINEERTSDAEDKYNRPRPPAVAACDAVKLVDDDLKDVGPPKVQAGECEICEKTFDNIIAHVYNHPAHVERSKAATLLVPTKLIDDVQAVVAGFPGATDWYSGTATSNHAAPGRHTSQRSGSSFLPVSDGTHKPGLTAVPYHAAQSLRRVLVFGSMKVEAAVPHEVLQSSDGAALAGHKISSGTLMSHLAGPPPPLANFTFCRTCAPLPDRHPTVERLIEQAPDGGAGSPQVNVVRFDTDRLRYEWNSDFLDFADKLSQLEAGTSASAYREGRDDHMEPVLLALQKLADMQEKLEISALEKHEGRTGVRRKGTPGRAARLGSDASTQHESRNRAERDAAEELNADADLASEVVSSIDGSSRSEAMDGIQRIPVQGEGEAQSDYF